VVDGRRGRRCGIRGPSGFRDPRAGNPADARDTSGARHAADASAAVGFASFFAAVAFVVEFAIGISFAPAGGRVVGCPAGA